MRKATQADWYQRHARRPRPRQSNRRTARVTAACFNMKAASSDDSSRNYRRGNGSRGARRGRRTGVTVVSRSAGAGAHAWREETGEPPRREYKWMLLGILPRRGRLGERLL
ncbi:hypothetical protein EVAR_9329_1 [Eumeta japonica]|uniref:Uncharacterized protein n=1 Tax=Eumeta variegata TaxID=151549 RepID=A0A4C1TN35_EUMVA|nr:hypothetical protein EVAR_9329_1 [Eumeta japonica]